MTSIRSESFVATGVSGGTEAAEPGSQIAAAAAAACGHRACAAAPVCLVAQLEETLKGYVRGRGADSFRIFGTRRAINTLASATRPLRTPADVDDLSLGALTTVLC